MDSILACHAPTLKPLVEAVYEDVDQRVCGSIVVSGTPEAGSAVHAWAASQGLASRPAGQHSLGRGNPAAAQYIHTFTSSTNH